MAASVKIIVKKDGKVVGRSEADNQQKTKVTLGKGDKNDIKLSIEGIPESFPILMFHQSKFFVALPKQFSKGFVEKSGKQINIADLVSKGVGKESQGLIWVVLDDNGGGKVEIDGYEILIGKYALEAATTPKAAPATEKKAPEKKVESKPTPSFTQLAGAGGMNFEIPEFHIIKRKSFHVYLIILAVSLLLNVGGMIYVGTMELPPESDDISAIPTRFAKLIVENVPKPEKKPETGTEESKEEKQQAAVQDQKEEETTTEEKKAATGKVDEKERIKKIKEKVRRVGVLAIISSKGGGGVIQDVISNTGVGDLDTALSKVGGVTTAGSDVDLAAIKKTRIGGAAKSADIGSLGVGPGQKVSLGDKKVKRVVASINLGGGKVSGDISGAVVRNVVKRNIRGVKYCYEKELKRNPKLQGKVTILFTISPQGRISKAKVQHSTIRNKNVESCIIRMVLRWRFPPPKNKKSVTVSYPFIFAPGS